MIVQWRKSSYTGGANDEHCVELGSVAQKVAIRDSKDPDGGYLSLSTGRFAELVGGIKRGSYDG